MQGSKKENKRKEMMEQFQLISSDVTDDNGKLRFETAVTEGLIPKYEAILKVAREYDYIPTVQNQDQANSMLIGVILFDLYNEFFSKLAMSLVTAANNAGYSVIFQFSNKNEKSERTALEY